MAIIDTLNSYFDNEEYSGSTVSYFVKNIVEFEKFVLKARSPKFKQKYGMTAYEALSKAIFESDGISTAEGKPLSKAHISNLLKCAKQKNKQE